VAGLTLGTLQFALGLWTVRTGSTTATSVLLFAGGLFAFGSASARLRVTVPQYRRVAGALLGAFALLLMIVGPTTDIAVGFLLTGVGFALDLLIARVKHGSWTAEWSLG
jgi:peptidoglycan/LPS O-acetylase OafA/YrhL